MNTRKKLLQLSFGNHLQKMQAESKNARNHYTRPRDNMGVLHRRNK